MIWTWLGFRTWCFNPNAKLKFNCVLTHRDVPTALGEGGFMNGIGARLA